MTVPKGFEYIGYEVRRRFFTAFDEADLIAILKASGVFSALFLGEVREQYRRFLKSRKERTRLWNERHPPKSGDPS